MDVFMVSFLLCAMGFTTIFQHDLGEYCLELVPSILSKSKFIRAVLVHPSSPSPMANNKMCAYHDIMDSRMAGTMPHDLLPRKLRCFLKINGCKMYLLLK